MYAKHPAIAVHRLGAQSLPGCRHGCEDYSKEILMSSGAGFSFMSLYRQGFTLSQQNILLLRV